MFFLFFSHFFWQKIREIQFYKLDNVEKTTFSHILIITHKFLKSNGLKEKFFQKFLF